VAGGLYHFGERYYDPSTGSWTQQDPIGQQCDVNSADPFTFSGDAPVNQTDPKGTYWSWRSFFHCIFAPLHAEGLRDCDLQCADCGQ
jgi:RHS repeat-associated protein